jgi:hypothetical protein
MTMAGLQTLINVANGLSIDRRKVVGIQITRNEIPRVTQTPTLNPWRFGLDVPTAFRYSEARDLIEALDTLDRINPETITFSNNTKLNWMFAYQGQMTQVNINSITVQSFIGDQLTLTNLPSIASTKILFKPNDLIQIGASGVNPFPFTSVGTVLRGTGTTVVVTTNRPNIITADVTGNSIIVGNTCQFKMFCPNMPTYKLIVGGYKKLGNTVYNNALIEFSDSFKLYEAVSYV